MKNSKTDVPQKINYSKERLIKIFVGFLKREGIYTKWKMDADCKLYNKNIYSHCGREAINYSMTWANTKEGYDFWAYYDAKWKNEFYNGEDIVSSSSADNYNENWRRVKHLYYIA